MFHVTRMTGYLSNFFGGVSVRHLKVVSSTEQDLSLKLKALATEFNATTQELEAVEECVRYYRAIPRHVLKVSREANLPVSRVVEIYEIRDSLPGVGKVSIIGVARMMRDYQCDIVEILAAIETALDFMSQSERYGERDASRCIRIMRDFADNYGATSVADILDVMETALAA